MHRPLRRLCQLVVGLALYGASLALFVGSTLGGSPWDVLHQGLSRRTGLSVGTWVLLVGVLVLLLWVPLRQRPGVGTVGNVLLIGLFLDLTARLLPRPDGLPAELLMLLAGLVLNAIASATYLGARLGPGPRDGLMTGLAARGHPVRVVRTGIEVLVLLAGLALGGTSGVGTLLYAFAIGPLVQPLLPLLRVPEPGAATAAGTTARSGDG